MYSIKTLYKIGKGPSSSHTMGPRNAVLYILEHYPNAELYEMYIYESLALTGVGHLLDYIVEKTFGDIPHKLIFDMETKCKHPNTMVFKIHKDGKILEETIYSIGGGLIDVVGVEDEGYVDVYPHKNFSEIKDYCVKNNISLPDYVRKYEDESLFEHMEKVYSTMRKMVDEGLQKDGHLPGKLHVSRKAKKIYNKVVPHERADMKEKRLISSYAFAASEENACGSTVVTAPTCGACGIMPALLKYCEDLGFTHQQLIDGLLVAGIIGLVVKHNASISGAECGCQAEVGTAISMGAGFVAQLYSQDVQIIERAAEIAMEHTLGLTCDPIDGYVQIPCIERNAMGALRAIDSAMLTHLINTTDSKISFDTVVQTMYQTGKDLHNSYRETSTGGLAKTYKS